MLPNGADLRLTDSASVTYDYILDPNISDHWDHQFQELLANRQVGAGLPDVQNLIPWKLPWKMTDWSGGENARYFRSTDPTQYDYASSGHGRLPGIIKGTPTVTAGSYSPDALPARAYMVTGDGVLWLVGDRVSGSAIANVVAKSTDASTWTTVAVASPGINHLFTAATGDNGYLYYATANGTPDVSVYRVKADASGNVQVVLMVSPESAAIQAMALSGPYLYTLSAGGKLRQFDTTVTASFPYATGTRIITLPTLTASGTTVMMSKGDTSIYILISRSGNTEIYELSAPDTSSAVCSLIWGGANSGLQGFTGTALGFADGVIYLGGYFGDGNTNRACLYGMSATARVPEQVGYFRVENASTTSLEPRFISSGEGNQIQIGMKTGQTFIYDKAQDSISLLDTNLLWTALDSTAAFAGKRVSMYRNTATGALKTSAYTDDYAASTGGFDLFSPTWDYNLPYLKQLSSIEVEYKPITGAETIVIKYQLDESGSYTALTTINSSSTGAAQGRTTLTGSTVASMKKFRKISFECVGTGGAELRDATAIAELVDSVETINAALWIIDESVVGKPRDNQRSAQDLLDKFYNSSTGLKRLKNLVTLTVGAESPLPNSSGQQTFTARLADCRFVRRVKPTYPGYRGLEGTLYVQFVSEP